MKKAVLLIFLFSPLVYSQTSGGVIGGQNLTMDKQVLGVVLNKRILPHLSGGVGYLGLIENFDEGIIMANYQIIFFNFSIGSGMGIPVVKNKKIFPFLIATYKPFKKQSLRIFINLSNDRQVVGFMYPLFKTKKMLKY